MPKLLPVVIWTLGVAALAFLAGRLTAPADEIASTLNLSVAPETNSGFVAQSPVVVPASIAQPSQPKNGGALSRGYAADYQQMQLLVALAATNPQLAMEKAAHFKGVIKAKAQAAILDVWGANDPAAAWNWVETVQPENNQQLIKLLEVIGTHEPRTAVAYAEKFVAAHRELRKDSYTALLTGMTQGGAYQQAMDVLSRLELEPESKTELTNLVVSAWAAYEPQAALHWLATQSEDVRTSAMAPLGESLAETDPQAAVNFAASVSGPESESLLLPAFQKWLRADAAAAGNWLASAPPNKDFDPIISELATQPASNNSQVREGLVWAGKIQNPELRMATATSILSAFKQKDPTAAAAYLQELTYLSDKERAQLKEDLAFEH